MMRFLFGLFGKKRSELVPYHDFATGKTVMIPKAELSPGAVLIQINGDKQPVYTDASMLKQGPYQHPPFEGEERAAIHTLVEDLAEVYAQTYEEWEDGFRRDLTPAQEIAGWIHLASILRVMSDRFSFSLAEKRECFRLLVACFTGARDSVRERCDTTLLSDDQIKLALKYFYEGGYR
jgi:hypothetical protein